MRRRIILFAGMIAVIFVAVLAGIVIYQESREYTFSPPDQSHYKETETLKIVVDKDYPPLSFIDKNGNPAGHDIELGYAIGQELGKRVKVDLLSWSEAKSRFHAKEYDLMFGVTHMPSSDWATFSLPVFSARYTVFGRDVSNFSIPKMYHAKLAFLKNKAVHDVLVRDHLLAHNIIELPSYTDCFKLLMSGGCDYVLAPKSVGASIIKKLNLSGIEEYKGAIYNSYFTIAVQPDNPLLLEQVNTALKTLGEKGELDRIYDYWIKGYVGANNFSSVVKNHPYVFIALAVLIPLIVGFMLLLGEYRREHLLRLQMESEKKLADLRAQIELVLKGIAGGFAIVKGDENRSLVHIDDSLSALMGYTPEEFIKESGNTTAGILPMSDFITFKNEMDATKDQETYSAKFRVRCKDGGLKWISSNGRIIFNEKGEKEFYSFNHDVTPLEEAMALLRQEQRMYRDTLLFGCEYAYIANVTENRFHSVFKSGYLDRYGFDPSLSYDETMSRIKERMKPTMVSGPLMSEFHLTTHYLWAYIQEQRLVNIEYHIPDTDEYKRKIVFLSKNEETDVMYVFVVAYDISATRREDLEIKMALTDLSEAAKEIGKGHFDTKIDTDVYGDVGILATVLDQMQSQLRFYVNRMEKQTVQDPLTGVKNKRAWQDEEKRMNDRILAGDADFAVAICDVNGLKQVNDNFGHEAGDSLIVRACRYICKTFKRSPVFRIGGDEFAVLLENEDLSNSEWLLDTFYAGMANQEKGTDPAEPPVSIALGLSHYTGSDTEFSDVVHRADLAMYQNKAAMKNAQ